MDHFETLRQVMSQMLHVPPEAITRTTTQEDVASWDSVEHLNLMMAVEDRFAVTLEVEDLGRLVSVQALLDFLEAQCPS